MHTRIALLILMVTAVAALRAPASGSSPRPNILWIACEDISPNIGCYGDKFADTPNLDRLAAGGVRYANCFSVAGVCAPSRSSLITGMYPSSLGSQHMRCTTTLPPFVNCFPAYLRAAGYYCSNNAKQDYNFTAPADAWDESSGKAHWRNRQPDQPFFSVFNLEVTHESRIRAEPESFARFTQQLTPAQRHDPAKVAVPPWHPDTPLVRRDWANYYDLITAMDYQVADLLAQLAADGLADDTIVFFFSDHGAGLPRAKQWIFEAGLQVPLLIRFPEKFRHLAPAQPSAVVERLVSFVDFAPSVLSLCGVKAPAHVQGVAFLGAHAGPPREFVFGIRDRMDERVDMMRTVRDARFKYHRNYLPHLPFAQPIEYMDLLPTMKELRRLSAAGQLTGAAAHFMAPTKAAEELYDLRTDPHETRNLAGLLEYEPVLRRMREAHSRWARDTRDLSLLPEAEMRARAEGSSPYEVARRGDTFPLERLLQTAELTRSGAEVLPKMVTALKDDDSAVRYWGASALTALGAKAQPAADALAKSLADSSPNVRIAAAHALCNVGRERDAVPVLAELLADQSEWVRVAAVNVLDLIDEKARPAFAALRKATRDGSRYVRDPAGRALAELTPAPAPGPLLPVGVARVDITPDGPIRLSGYATRRKESEGVAQKISAKALAFGSDEQGPAVLITAELVGVPGWLTDELAARLAKKTKVDRAHLAVCATHTHTGPCVKGVLPFIFGEAIPPEHQARIDRYSAQLLDKLEQLALDALAARRPARLAWTQGSVSFAANRRALKDGKWTGFGVNPDGATDHALPVLRVTDPNGKVLAIFTSYACHCTTLGGDFNQVHGDWAGTAQAMFERNYPGAMAMIAIGCGGDANPEPRGSLANVAPHAGEIFNEAERLLRAMQPLRSTPQCQFQRIELPFDKLPTRAEWEQRAKQPGRRGFYARVVLDRLDHGQPPPATVSYPVQTWTFGDDLAMVFLGGEVVVDYSLRLKRELDVERLWVNAYANDATCYIASRRVIAEGGYEVDSSMDSYDRPAQFAPTVEDLIISTVKAMLPAGIAPPANAQPLLK